MMISDRLGNILGSIEISRIVSLVPSWSEFIFDIGVGDKLVGRTDFCVFPETIQKIDSVRGTKNPNIEKIARLQPDLIIANKEENRQYDINRLRSLGLNIFVSSCITVEETVEEIIILEYLLTSSKELGESIETALKSVEQRQFSFLYVVWDNPTIVAGTETYISKCLEFLGGRNSVETSKNRYPKLKKMELKGLTPDIVFLPSEPYKFDMHNSLKYQKLFSNAELVLIDGKVFSWYGKRLASIGNELGKILS